MPEGFEPIPAIDTRPAKWPVRLTLEGDDVQLVPLNADVHAKSLWDATQADRERLWRYIPDGPFDDFEQFEADIKKRAQSEDPVSFAVVDRKSNLATGRLNLMRIDTKNRAVEVGGIVYSPQLQRTRGATEAMYLIARYAFEDLGYRRYEWKCDALNEASRRAALRLGFRFEGVFRQHMIVKGRNRDTAWFSMLDCEWPDRKKTFERWLHPSNFDAEGRQRESLSAINGQLERFDA